MELAFMIIAGTFWVQFEKLKDEVEILKYGVQNELVVDPIKPLVEIRPMEPIVSEGEWETHYPQEYYDNLPAVEPDYAR